MKIFKQVSLISGDTAYKDSTFKPDLSPEKDTAQLTNDIVRFYHEINGELADEYPYLTKVIYLALMTQSSLVLYSSRKGEIKEICKNICRSLGLRERLYHCNEQTTRQDVFISQDNQKSLYVLFNLSHVDNKLANEIADEIKSNVVICVENPKTTNNKQWFLHEEFSLCFVDEHDDNFNTLVDRINQKAIQKELNHKMFIEYTSTNIEYAENMKEEEGFLKIYLLLLKQILADNNITLAHSRWKSLLKYLKITGMNKVQNRYKRLSLVDCTNSTMFLTSEVKEYQLVNTVNEQVIWTLLKVYGVSKFSKYLDCHFWISAQRKKYYAQKLRTTQPRPTFFYPCSRFSNYVSIVNEKYNGKYQVNYRIVGADKKLMSDRYIEVNQTSLYKLQLELKTSHRMLIYIGLACYDSNKKFINTIQVCKRKNTEVTIQDIIDDQVHITPDDHQNLSNWNSFVQDQAQNFAYLRSIGVYADGKTDTVLPLEYIYFDTEHAYDVKQESGAYKKVDLQNNTITLNKLTTQKLTNLLQKNIIKKGVTKLMNHFEAGTYVIGRLINDHIFEWANCDMEFQGMSMESSPNKFLMNTKYVRIIVMSNYNSGYPEFKIDHKEAELFIRNVLFFEN